MAVTEINMWSSAHYEYGADGKKDYDASDAKWDKFQLEFFHAMVSGPQYVRINGKSRDGTIALATPAADANVWTRKEWKRYQSMTRDEFIAETGTNQYSNILTHLFGSVDTKTNEPVAPYTYAQYAKYHKANAFNFKLVMDDGREVKVDRDSFSRWGNSEMLTVTWLKGYEGPTVFKFAKTPKAVREAKLAELPRFTDIMNQEVKEKDVVAIVTGFDLWVGNVVSLSKTGKSIKVKVIGQLDPVQVSHESKVLVINDDTKRLIAIEKLTRV